MSNDLISREAAIAAVADHSRKAPMATVDTALHLIRAIPAVQPSENVAGMVAQMKSACVGRPATISWPHYLLHDAADMLTRIDADLTASRAEVVRLHDAPPQVAVKPLEWEYGDRNGGFYAMVPIRDIFTCYYQITQEEFGLATVEFGIHCHEFGRRVVWKGPSAQAKSAAQADHEARILAMLK